MLVASVFETTVEIPMWLALVIGGLGVIGLIDRLLVPGVRWFFRRRVNRAISELNTKLRLRIQPFKVTKRQTLIDQLLFDPQVLAAVEATAAEENEPREIIMNRARRYAREIVPSFSAYAYFRIGTRLSRAVSKLLYRVRLGYSDDESLRAIDPDSTVVFVINHRSNMDYVLVTYMAAASSALSYAVGEWARVWLLQSIIRSMGAYFIRRSSPGVLYRKVLARYVHMATQGGVTQAVFPEGGLTRDGALRPPKFGLFSYMVCGFDPKGPRDVVFIPVGLNYDRVLEDRVLTSAAERKKGEAPKFRFNPLVFTRFLGRNIWLALRGRWFRYGYACVSFGRPISLRAHLASRGTDFRTLDDKSRFNEIEVLGQRLMKAVGDVVPALPVSLVATALIDTGSSGQAVSLFELKSDVFNLMRRLQARGAYIHIPRSDHDYAVTVGLRMLTLRHLVLEEDGLYRLNAEEIPVVRFYANAIRHLFQDTEIRSQKSESLRPDA